MGLRFGFSWLTAKFRIEGARAPVQNLVLEGSQGLWLRRFRRLIGAILLRV